MEPDCGPGALFNAAREHGEDPSTSLAAIAVAMSELVRVGYSIDNRLRDLQDRLGEREP
jgi:hypothetical protein